MYFYSTIQLYFLGYSIYFIFKHKFISIHMFNRSNRKVSQGQIHFVSADFICPLFLLLLFFVVNFKGFFFLFSHIDIIRLICQYITEGILFCSVFLRFNFLCIFHYYMYFFILFLFLSFNKRFSLSFLSRQTKKDENSILLKLFNLA